jgi:mannitol/fructose-specific phosphotransferase system IIA component (Ntr-type)
MTSDRLKRLARPGLELREGLPLEDALARFQRRHDRLALVVNADGEWTGILTFADVLEEIVGKVGDEFDPARAGQFISLADCLTPRRIVFQLQARSMSEAIQNLMARIPREDLPGDPPTITQIVLKREQAMPTYIGKGLAIPHGRLDGIDRPILAFARSDEGVPLETSNERAELIFLLLTPSGMPRIQTRLLADIGGLFHSEYVTERLRKTQTPEAVIEAIRAGQEVAVD